MDDRSMEEITLDKKILNWMKENRHLMAASVLIGLLLTPFLWPFFLAIIYNALSLAVPIFLILVGIKMPWRNAKDGNGRAGAVWEFRERSRKRKGKGI